MTSEATLLGREATVEFETEPAMSASVYGNAGLDVLSTPALVSLFELAAMAAIESSLEPGWRSVGTAIEIRHIAATPIGETVSVHARVTETDGRQIRFAVDARDAVGLVGDGTHGRAIVNDERFLDRLRKSRQG